MTSYKKNNHSFTFIEVLLVVLLLGIGLVVGLPNFREIYRRLKAEAEVNNIVTFLRYAQEHAVRIKRTKQLPTVEINAEERELILKYGEEEEILRKLVIKPEVEITTETPTLVFDSMGGIHIFNLKKYKSELLYGAVDIADNYGRQYKIDIYSMGYINFKRLK